MKGHNGYFKGKESFKSFGARTNGVPPIATFLRGLRRKLKRKVAKGTIQTFKNNCRKALLPFQKREGHGPRPRSLVPVFLVQVSLEKPSMT